MPSVIIDSRYQDVDFTKEPEFVFGAQGPPAFEEQLMSSYEESVEIMTDSQIRQEIEVLDSSEVGGAEELVTRIYDQGREGACVGNGTAQGHQVVQAKQYGKERVVQLSAMSLYKQIGRSASSGATVSSGLRAGSEVGILPLDTPFNRVKFGDRVMPNTGFKTPHPQGWKGVAALHTFGETHVVRTVKGLLTALCRQEPVVVGREGHCILYLRPLWDRNQYKSLYVNSWGSNWGMAIGEWAGGFGVDTFSQIVKSAQWAFVIRTVKGRAP